MSHPRSSILTALFLPLLAGIILLLLLTTGYLLQIPGKAEQIFGPPNPQLSLVSRYRLTIQLLLQEKDLTTPVDPSGNEIPFKVSLGESVPSVIQRLDESGLIHNPGAFRAFLQYTGQDTSLQAGNYRLSPAQSPLEIAHQMQDSTPMILPFNILKGWRLEEVAAALISSGLEISPKAFIAAAQVRTASFPISDQLPERATLEGFLFPGSYEVPRQINAPQLIELMLTRFNQEVSDELRQAFTSQDLTLYEAVTLASIIERETVVEDEMPIIASVFYNRLKTGMNLGADPTVQYSIGYNESQKTWWTNPLSASDLQTESLYNTYLYPGLPPGPIANPGLQALRAVAFPAQTPYFYFRALCDGSGRHAFSETFEEHQSNACP